MPWRTPHTKGRGLILIGLFQIERPTGHSKLGRVAEQTLTATLQQLRRNSLPWTWSRMLLKMRSKHKACVTRSQHYGTIRTTGAALWQCVHFLWHGSWSGHWGRVSQILWFSSFSNHSFRFCRFRDFFVYCLEPRLLSTSEDVSKRPSKKQVATLAQAQEQLARRR